MQKILPALLKWSPSSAGAAITLHALWQQQWTQGAIAFTGTAVLSLLTAYSDKFTAILKQAVEQRGERDARWVVGQIGGMGFGDRYRQSLIYSYRTTRTQGFDLAPFKPDLEQVYVPLRVQASSLPQLPTAMIQPERSIDALSIWPFLVTAPAARIALIGPPGSGKSTLLEHLALTYARKSHRQQHPKAPDRLPVLLYLRDWRDAIAADSPPTLVQLIEQQVQKQPSDRPLENTADWFAARLTQGECLVMLDGLDEVADPAQRQKVAQWVNQQMQRYGRSPFILTSRPFGYDSVKTYLPQIDLVLGVQPFHWREVEQFIARWYRENESKRQARSIDPGVEQAARSSAADLLRRIQTSPPLAAMAVNPLLLTMIATVHCYRGALPGRRVELYAEICDVLLGRRQEAKGLGDRLSAAQKQIVLQVLALKGMQRNTREFKLVTACLLIRQRLAAVAGAEADPIEFLQSIERVSGLLVQREQDVYEFAHKSLQEYLAAKQIKDINQEMLLARHLDDPWWEETIRLYAAQADASYLIQTAIDRNTVQSLAIAYDCLEEGLRVDPAVRKNLEVAIEKGLESTNPEIFKLAAEVKLSRRLKNLLRIDDKTEIDLSYITCAEYQLFIDEKRSIGQNRQPDHWTSDRFTPGDANKPIAGVRASDAIEFCDWLTARSSVLGDVYEEGGDRVYVGEFRFRVLSPVEAQEYPLLQASNAEKILVEEKIRIAKEQVYLKEKDEYNGKF